MRSDEELKETILKNAEEIRRLHGRIGETFRLRDRSKEDHETWSVACSEYRSHHMKLAFPGGGYRHKETLQKILSGERNTVQTAICFLEVRPYFPTSGYMWKDFLRKMKRAPLSPQVAARLAVVIENYARYHEERRQRLALSS